MTWGAVAGAAVGVVGNALMSDSGGGGGGAGTQTQSKEPWAPIQPWILNNAVQGQNLQQQLMATPFSAQQQAAYNNSYGLGDYMRSAVPSLLGQLSGQQVGFDRSNQNARPQAWNWNAPTVSGAPNIRQQSVLDAQPVAAPAAAPAAPKNDFVQQGYADPYFDKYMANGGDLMGNMIYINPSNYTGKFGTFKYGDAMPQAGTQAYKDMNDYFAYGGQDPMNMYGHGPKSTRVIPVGES